MVLFFYSSLSIFLFCVLSAAEFLQDDIGSHQNLRLSISTEYCQVSPSGWGAKFTKKSFTLLHLPVPHL